MHAEQYIADTVLMIRPVRFGYNELTAESNRFQHKPTGLSNVQIQDLALLEFDNMVVTLRAEGIEVLLYTDGHYPYTPDSIFPNNWLSTCPHNKTLYTYPMMAPNRADERRPDIIEELAVRYGYRVHREFEQLEAQRRYLEGTGSLVLDHRNRIAYAAISPRTHYYALHEWCDHAGYEPEYFSAYGPQGEPVYHTNVVMCVTDTFVVLAADAIPPGERAKLEERITDTGKSIIRIDNEQTHRHFAGNMLQLRNREGQNLLIMSTAARRALRRQQTEQLEDFGRNRLIAVPLNIIEKVGGGSARCMMAEIFP